MTSPSPDRDEGLQLPEPVVPAVPEPQRAIRLEEPVSTASTTPLGLEVPVNTMPPTPLGTEVPAVRPNNHYREFSYPIVFNYVLIS